jgi:hypothetical protein
LSEFAIPFFNSMEKLLADGKIKTHPARINDGGLEAVIDGVGVLQRKEISAEKLASQLLRRSTRRR